MLTVIGDDRAGLVKALAEVVTAHGGNWEHSQMAELAGQFAGIVVVTIPSERADEFTAALGRLEGLMEVSAHPGAEAEAGESRAGWQPLTLDLLGNDRPGIVNEVTGVLTRHGLSIDTISTESRDAPMAGGRLFEAHVVAHVPPTADHAALRTDLEELATELLVELTVE